VADTTVWIPPGRWVDFFTGATFTGPMTTTVSVPLSRMPVFVRAGGIIPQQSADTSSTASNPVTVEVFSGSSGSFSLYGDAGKGLGYTTGQYTETPITDSVGGADGGAPTASRVAIGAAQGHYPGEPAAVYYRLEMVDLTQPTGVTANGHLVSHRAPGSQDPGWYYQPNTATVVINAGSMPTTRTFSVVATGSRTVDSAEPSALSPSTWPGH
jgi:hypothetical protein